MFKKKNLVIFLITFFLVTETSLYSYSSNPEDFVKELVTESINKLSDKNLTKEEKVEFVEKVAKENVDIKALSLYTLGELRKSSNESDLKSYQNSFESYFLKSLTSRLSDYSSSKFEITVVEKKKYKLHNS